MSKTYFFHRHIYNIRLNAELKYSFVQQRVQKKAEVLSAKKLFALFEVCLIEAVLIAVFENLEDHFAFADLEDGARLHVGA